MINEKADVFFGDASAVDSGARQAIDKANNGTVKIIDIGQPSDLLGQNPCVACSVVTDNAGMDSRSPPTSTLPVSPPISCFICASGTPASFSFRMRASFSRNFSS